MRLATWNLNHATWSQRARCTSREEHRQKAWETLAGLDADVALVQEAPPPPANLSRPPLATIPQGGAREDWRSFPGPRRWWCSAVTSWGPPLSPLPEDREPLAETHPGAYRLAMIPWNGRSLVVVSVYALWDYDGLVKGAKPLYAETSLHRTLSDLTPIIDVTQSRLPVVLAGDLNASTQFPRPHREAYRVVHARLGTLGLRNVSVRPDGSELPGCPCEDVPCRHLRTLEGPTPYQDDYIYASPDVAEAIQLVEVERTAAIETVSDHFPLICEI